MNLDELLHEVRRIEKSRMILTEKKIRKIYKQLEKKLNGFLGNMWAKYSDNDGRLTVQQLKNAGKYAKFLEEIAKNVETLTSAEKTAIMDLVDKTYKKAYQGMVNAVQKAEANGRLKEVTQDINIPDRVTNAAYNNNISKLTLAPIFQRNRANIIYDIQQTLNIGLMNGDRFDTMAKKIQDKVNFGYNKAIRVVRTEAHRNIESGFNDCAREIQNGLGGSDFVYAAIWRTMKDERVRPQVRYYTAKRGWVTKTPFKATANHIQMEGKIIQVGDLFDLGNGVTAPCPGMSGTANNDCNCRCFLEYEMMTKQEFLDRGGKLVEKSENRVENSDESDIIKYVRSEVIPNMKIDKIVPRQDIHIQGTKMYENRKKELEAKGQYGPSYLTIAETEVLELVKKYSGTGEIYCRNGKWNNIEIITNNDKIVGVVYDNRNGNNAKTSVFKIHYSNNGVHIVPDYPSKKKR